MKAPVLLIIFNRPDTTQKVFESIRAAEPEILLVSADAPRPNNEKDEIKCEQTRAIIDQVDWNCKVIKNYAKSNLGCKYGPISAIDWAFTLVDTAIILEDDCLPGTTFFQFCDQMLDRYRDDRRVMQIAGTNLVGEWKSQSQSYHFSYSGCIWGWATWKRAWRHYDADMKLFEEPEARNRLKDVLTGEYELKRRTQHWETAINNNIDAWDYQWDFARFMQSGLCIVPAKNLVVNLGFGHADATHTHRTRNGLENQRIHTLTLPVEDSPFLIVDGDYDKAILPVIYPNPSRASAVTRRILKRIRKRY